jgi:HTH-type transcriptional regulator/antitoxin MqsA
METKQCGACGGVAMALDTRDQGMPYKGETITVKALPGWYCPDCGDSEFVNDEDAQRFSDEVALAMKAITTKQAADLRSIRKRLGLKQAEAAALFGGGVNAFSEYERGIRQPSKSTVLLLKLLDHHPELLSEIRAS